MYNVNDTICATATAAVPAGKIRRSIIRVSGEKAFSAVSEVFVAEGSVPRRGVTVGAIVLDAGVRIDAFLYSFGSPRSYTGEDLAELHFFAGAGLVEAVVERLCDSTRLAGPGEFTLRAYLNGRIDLSQAEAVAEIVSSSNSVQLQAAQKLLDGRLAIRAGEIRLQILDIMSLLEAGMDFSQEDIEFVTTEKAVETIGRIKEVLQGLLAGAIRNEEMIDLPSVGLVGASNAGKSSLLNVLLGSERSIVSSEQATTRDVLTGVLELDKARCMLFDCAGLGFERTAVGLLDELARQAAREAVNTADLVLLCVDCDKSDYSEDVEIAKSITRDNCILVGTKADLLSAEQLVAGTARMKELFGLEVLVTSAHTRQGVDDLSDRIEADVIRITTGTGEAADRISINQRHRRLVTEAVGDVGEAAVETAAGNNEIAAMLLRSAWEKLGGLEKEDIDEAILERIFSNFCIGK